MNNELWKRRILAEMRKWATESELADYSNIKLYFDENNLSQGYSIIYCINENSPFWGLPLYFKFTIPPEYPHRHPTYKFISPLHFGSGVMHCRIHPNLYSDGKVCLSIFGTWQGEPWKPCSTQLIANKTIESILDDNPITHEPGFNYLEISNPTSIDYRLNSLYRSFMIVTNMIEKFKKKDPSIMSLPYKEWIIEKIINARTQYIERIKDLPYSVSSDIIHGSKEVRDFPRLLTRFIELTKDLVVERDELEKMEEEEKEKEKEEEKMEEKEEKEEGKDESTEQKSESCPIIPLAHNVLCEEIHNKEIAKELSTFWSLMEEGIKSAHANGSQEKIDLINYIITKANEQILNGKLASLINLEDEASAVTEFCQLCNKIAQDIEEMKKNQIIPGLVDQIKNVHQLIFNGNTNK